MRCRKNGSSTSPAPAGAGTPTKKSRLPVGPRLLGEQRGVEAGEPQPRADREDERADPAERGELVEPPDKQEERRRDAEIDEVGERVELLAKARGGAEIARQPPVDAVEDDGEDDRRDCEIEAVLDRHADRGQPGAEPEQRHEVGQDGGERHQPPSRPAALGFRIEGGKEAGHSWSR